MDLREFEAWLRVVIERGAHPDVAFVMTLQERTPKQRVVDRGLVVTFSDGSEIALALTG